MLYLHCGWLKTGTTSLQAALDRHREELESVGLVNLKSWRVLPKRLNGPEADKAIAEFVDDIAGKADRDLLLSCETYMNMMLTDRQQGVFLQMVEAAQAVMPVTCVWTLRRWDEMMRSYYLWQLSYGLDPPGFREYLAGLPRMDGIFSGLRRVEDTAKVELVYCKYDAAGSHNDQILHSFGLSPAIADAIAGEVRNAHRRNVAPSYKEAITLLNVEGLSKRAGIDLGKARLLEVFTSGDFRFEDDRPCELMGFQLKRNLHEGMLCFAREAGFETYVEFFEHEKISGPPVAEPLDSDAISDEDLGRLVARLQRPRHGYSDHGANEL